jgi:hypothetical protein
MTTTEIAQGLVDLCKNGQFDQAIKDYYSDNIVSVEAMGEHATMTGINAVLGKAQWFHDTMEVHSSEVSGPYVNGNLFAVRFTLDATNKETGQRSTMDEVALYTVEGDKIVHEAFLYAA